MSKTVECPNCHQSNAVPMAGIGQYVTCQFCGTKYYVYVPPLAETSGGSTEPLHVGRAAHEAHSDQAARPTPSDAHPLHGGVMIRQESLLATIHEDLVDLR